MHRPGSVSERHVFTFKLNDQNNLNKVINNNDCFSSEVSVVCHGYEVHGTW